MFPPQFCELPAPSLDLFDLDEHFLSERVHIAQLTNKCKYTRVYIQWKLAMCVLVVLVPYDTHMIVLLECISTSN